jgi:hypothetical protein
MTSSKLKSEIKDKLKKHPVNLRYCLALNITPQTLTRWLNTDSDQLTTKKSTDFICQLMNKRIIDIYEKENN